MRRGAREECIIAQAAERASTSKKNGTHTQALHTGRPLARSRPTRKQAAMGDVDIPPNQTIYIHNLNEKIKKDGASSGEGNAMACGESGASARL